jgi:putative DNA primase/helicase
MTASSISTAAIYRVIELLHPTLLIDEVDLWIKSNDEARGILNSGHTRGGAYVVRCNADSNEPERFSTWAPKVLSGIGELPDTLADRSIVIKLERREPKQKIIKVRDADPAQFMQVRQKLARWALDNRDVVANARPAIPTPLNDRQSDNWDALLAISDLLGGNWSQDARTAALSLSDADDVETTITLLLSKIREALNDLPDEQGSVPTDHLIECLNEDKEATWADWSRGNGITPHRLAKLLKPFSVKSERVWDGVKKVMSYTRKSLEPIFDRYLSPLPPKNGSEAATGS